MALLSRPAALSPSLSLLGCFDVFLAFLESSATAALEDLRRCWLDQNAGPSLEPRLAVLCPEMTYLSIWNDRLAGLLGAEALSLAVLLLVDTRLLSPGGLQRSSLPFSP